MHTTGEVALLTRDEELADLVLSAAAAAGTAVIRVTSAQAARGLLIVGADCAADGPRERLPAEAEVVLVGEDVAELARWSMAWQARVVGLPEGRAWLTSLLTGPRGRGRGRVVGVVGVGGGAGASTLVVGLATELSASGRQVATVDADPGSGGLDLLWGAEASPGWRWPTLLHAVGEVGDLRGSLVRVGGVDVVSQGRAGDAPSAVAMQAVVRSLARTHEVVLLDAGRGEPATVALCDAVAVLVPARVGGLAAANRVVTGLRRARADAQLGLVVRRGPVSARDVQAAVGLPLWAEVPDDKGLAGAAEEGILPHEAAGRSWRRAVAALSQAVVA